MNINFFNNNILIALISSLLLFTPSYSFSNDLNGQWIGSTSQGFDLTFTVNNGLISQYEISSKINGLYCTSTKYTTFKNIEIDNNIFKYEEIDDTTEYDLSGSFDTLTVASGSMEITHNHCAGNEIINWNANLYSENENDENTDSNLTDEDNGGCFINTILTY